MLLLGMSLDDNNIANKSENMPRAVTFRRGESSTCNNGNKKINVFKLSSALKGHAEHAVCGNFLFVTLLIH